MKKFFTLIAAAMLSSGAFAQNYEWQNLVVNGNMEGAQDPMRSSFWCHDWRQDVQFAEESGQGYDADGSGQFRGFAEIVEDPADPNNHCARVIVRSKAESEETGIPTPGQTDFQSWDSQFFIYATETIPEGKEIRMTLKVKAEKAGSFETQAHWAPGDYNHYQLFGNLNYGTEWTTIEATTTVTADQTKEADGKFFQSVAFNLSTMQDGNIIYFDDVKLEIRDAKGPEEFDRWIDMLRHGTMSADKVGDYTTFTGRDAMDGRDLPARIVADPIDGEPALTVSAVCWEGTETVPDLDEDGNQKVDDDGNPLFKDQQYWYKNGEKQTVLDDWQAQFFVTVPHKFIPNSQYRLVMWYRADKEAQVSTQLHTMPGGYVHWDAIGTLNCTPEWQMIEVEQEMLSQGKGCQTIAFNCNIYKDEPNNYYFRFDEFKFNIAEVTNEERTLGTENIFLPVPEPGAESATATVDFENCMKLLESPDFTNLINDDHLLLPINDQDEFSTAQQAAAGIFVDENGYLVEDGPVCVTADSDSKDNKVNYLIDNFSGESFDGKSIDSKFLFTYADWNYRFNVSLIPAAKYEEMMAGVSSLKVAQPENVIYDLQGRRVKDAVKGLYIVNGKKVVK
ncbi:MAG: hypothetical protein IJ892_13015 [Prevotella sp.]|nr:hypothetical protein [Prevotella sp.]